MWDFPLPLNRWPNQHPDIYHVQPFYKAFWAKTSNHHKPCPRKKEQWDLPRKKSHSLLSGQRVSKTKRKRNFPIKDRKKNKGKKKKVPNQRLEENKGKKKIPDQRSEENERIIRKGLRTIQISKQYEIVTSKQEKKENHDLKWSLPFDCQPKSCALATFSPRTKKKNRKGKGPNIQSQIPHQNTIPEKVLLIHDHTRHLWFDRKWFAKLSHDISMV